MDKPIAWYDPSNGVVSTDRDCPLFTPLGQVWPLSLKGEWVGLTDDEIKAFDTWHDNREEEVGWCNPSEIVAYIEAKLKEKNT
jgi:hypothetical protein